jgi:hypothetical protein
MDIQVFVPFKDWLILGTMYLTAIWQQADERWHSANEFSRYPASAGGN